MPGIVFKLFGIAALAVSIAYMVASAFRQSRRLDARIRAFRKEQEELERQGKVQDPYAALAEVYQEQESGGKKAAGSGKTRK
jgi:type II secretory pathway pseudopilin PulG